MLRPVAYVACEKCGAGLPFADGDPVTCAYCRETQQAPDHLHFDALGDEAEAAHREGMHALASAWAKKWSPGALSSEIWAMSAVFLTCVGTVTLWALYELSLFTMVCVFLGLALMTLVPIGAALSALQGRARQRALEAARSEIINRVRRTKCPNCGGQLTVPGFAAAANCPFCAHPLAVAEGILIERLADAAERKERWGAAAEAYVDKLAETEAANAEHVPFVSILSLVLLLVGVVAVPMLVVWLVSS